MASASRRKKESVTLQHSLYNNSLYNVLLYYYFLYTFTSISCTAVYCTIFSCTPFSVQYLTVQHFFTAFYRTACLVRQFLYILFYNNFLYSTILHTCIISHQYPYVYTVVWGKKGGRSRSARAQARAGAPLRYTYRGLASREVEYFLAGKRLSLDNDIVCTTSFSVFHFPV